MTRTRSDRDSSEEGGSEEGRGEESGKEGTGEEGGGEEEDPQALEAPPADDVTVTRPGAPSTARAVRRLAAALLLGAAQAAGAATADTLVSDLDQRLAAEGADRVNAWLGAPGAAAMAALHRKAADCELPAVSLATRLTRSADTHAVQAHRDALRTATGRCAPFVLALAAPDEIVRVCASVPGWGPAQTARELRRRMAAIDAHAVLRSSARGKACRAAYLYELENTRVVLKSKPR